MVTPERSPSVELAPELSIVIPAYNESRRLNRFLDSVRYYLAMKDAPRTEVIVVDDGSLDGTGDLVDNLSITWPLVRCLRHERNRGKGAAVRTGLLAAKGRLLLFADADGSTPLEEERRLRDAISAGADLAAGSRLVNGAGVRRRRAWWRQLPARVFVSLVHRYLDLPVRDTQCGFKLLRQDTVLPFVRECVTDGYLFDVELLARIDRAGLRIAEVAVSWQDVPGSKVRLVRDSLAMWRGLRELQRMFP
jgi:dolichyl-phosphate beta-glucosyltransferase